MVAVATIKGTQLRIKIGDGNSPESFVEWCIINTDRGIQWDTISTDEEVPQCDEPEGLAWTENTKTGIGGTITGAGKLDTASLDNVWPWLISDDAKNLQIEVGSTGYYSGRWKLTAFGITGSRGTKADASLTLKSDGVQDWTANS